MKDIHEISIKLTIFPLLNFSVLSREVRKRNLYFLKKKELSSFFFFTSHMLMFTAHLKEKVSESIFQIIKTRLCKWWGVLTGLKSLNLLLPQLALLQKPPCKSSDKPGAFKPWGLRTGWSLRLERSHSDISLAILLTSRSARNSGLTDLITLF